MLRLRDHQISTFRAGNAAFDNQQVVVFIYTEDAEVAHSHAVVAHVSRHAHAFEHARGKCRTTDRACYLEHGPVRLRAATKMMAFYHALKTFAFAHTDYVNKLLAIKNFDQYAIAGFDLCLPIGLDWNFLNKLHRWQIVLRQVPAHRLCESRLFHEFNQSDLGGVVS